MTVGKWDPYQRDCPSRRLLDRIGDRWTVLVVGALDAGRGASARSPPTWTASRRRCSPRPCGRSSATGSSCAPPTRSSRRTSYELTDLGHSLHDPLRALERWAVDNMDIVATRQDAYDGRRVG